MVSVGERFLGFWRRDDRLYRLIVGSFKLGFRVLAIEFDIRGAEHIPARGPAVLANNHISFLDYAFTGLVADERQRLVRFLAKRSVFRSRLGGPLLRGMRHVAVDRSAISRLPIYGPADSDTPTTTRQAETATGGAPDAQPSFSAFETAGALLAEGELVGVFPEGTISRAFTLKPFQTGAAALAVTQRVPLVPIILWGGQRIWTVDGRHSLRRHIPVDIWVGEPIEPDERWNVPNQELIRTVNDRLQQAMQALLDEAQQTYPDRPRSDQDRWWLPHHMGGSAPTPGAAAVVDRRKRVH